MRVHRVSFAVLLLPSLLAAQEPQGSPPDSVASAAVAPAPLARETAVVGKLAEIAALLGLSLPADVLSFGAKMAPIVAPAVQSWARSSAEIINGRNLSAAAIIAVARKGVGTRFAGQKLSGGDVHALVALALVQAVIDAKREAKALQDEVQAARSESAAADSSAGAPMSKDGARLAEQEARLQEATNRVTRTLEALSSIMQKVNASTTTSAVSNLK